MNYEIYVSDPRKGNALRRVRAALGEYWDRESLLLWAYDEDLPDGTLIVANERWTPIAANERFAGSSGEDFTSCWHFVVRRGDEVGPAGKRITHFQTALGEGPQFSDDFEVIRERRFVGEDTEERRLARELRATADMKARAAQVFKTGSLCAKLKAEAETLERSAELLEQRS